MYIVIEIQKMSDTQIATLVDSYEDLNQAENKFHTILAAAAVSSLPMHSASMLTEDGLEIKHESYEHVVQSN